MSSVIISLTHIFDLSYPPYMYKRRDLSAKAGYCLATVRAWIIGLCLAAAFGCGGNGPTGTTPGRAIALSGNLAFGEVPVGKTATATLSIRSSGSEALAVSGISYPDGYTGNWASGQIAAGSSQTVIVTFAPTALRSYNGTAAVTSSATSGTNTIDVSGTGRQSWIITGLLKDWIVTPHDLTINGQEIYVSGTLDSRVAVLNLGGRVLRYYAIETNSVYDSVCVAVTSQGQVLAASSRGIWELKPDGTTTKLISFNYVVSHMTIGPDDRLFFSVRSQGKSKIMIISLLNGIISDFLTVDSEWISDIAFDSNGVLFMADVQYGRILKYSQDQGIKVFSPVFANPSGGEEFYLVFDQVDRIYISSSSIRLALVSADGTVIPLEYKNNMSGDLFFHDGLLYTLDLYQSTLYEINVSGINILSERILLNGVIPRYIESQGESMVVGGRMDLSKQKFCNYDITQPGRVEPNALLNTLQPNQFTFDDLGNMYLLFGRVLKKLDSIGREIFSVKLPHNFQWDTRLRYNPADGKIYYFDEDSNSIIRANAQGAETYHRFLSLVSKAYLSFSIEGALYAGLIRSDGALLVDISKSPEERVVWRWSTALGTNMLLIGFDAKGNLYGAMGPSFQQVLCIDPVKGSAVSLFDDSLGRYDWGFVDISGLAVTASGTVILSAPGLLLKFVPDI
jgi:WD40 repeat protein